MESPSFVLDEQEACGPDPGHRPLRVLAEAGLSFQASDQPLNFDRQEYKAILRSVYPGVRGPPYSPCSSHFFFATAERFVLLQRGGYLWHLCEFILLSWFYFYHFKKIHGGVCKIFFFSFNPSSRRQGQWQGETCSWKKNQRACEMPFLALVTQCTLGSCCFMVSHF